MPPRFSADDFYDPNDEDEDDWDDDEAPRKPPPKKAAPKAAPGRGAAAGGRGAGRAPQPPASSLGRALAPPAGRGGKQTCVACLLAPSCASQLFLAAFDAAPAVSQPR